MHRRKRLAHLRGNHSRQFAVDRVAGPHGNDMAADGFAYERQVTNHVQNFVPHELIRISQRLGCEHRVIADHDRIFQTAASNEPILDQVFDLVEKTECARISQFLFPAFGCDFDA